MTVSEPGLRRFDGKVGLVTGAAKGIGRACAHRLASEGCRLALADVDRAGLDQATAAAQEILGADDAAIAINCDISDEDQVADLVEGTVAHHGRLDTVVNMAGILASADSHLETLDQWNRTIAVNLTGCFLVCRQAIPHLLKTKGNIVNAASTASLSGHPWFAAYGASKGGVLMLTQSLAMEYAKSGLRVNAVAPGGIDTEMTQVELPESVDGSILARMIPLGPFGQPADVAGAVAFLASDDARFVNGEFLRVDGATRA